MSFKRPEIGPKDINNLLNLILEANHLTATCGHHSKRVDKLLYGQPYTMVTVYFRENVVQYAEQRNWKLKGLFGSISMEGNFVRARQRRNIEAAAKAKKAA
jgi:hypothetical protein